MNISKDKSKEFLYNMLLIREFEKVVSEYKMDNKIYGMVHCCIGQEAIAVGMCSALKKDDYIISNHRPHGHAIAKGADLRPMMAEIFGKETGSNGGKGGSMHITDANCGFITATGIVGSGIPVACGAAFASKYKQDNRVTCVFMGDGAANEGTFYESLNLAAKWELPIFFVVEDNGLAVTTLTDNTSACREYKKIAEAFGINATIVNGQDVEEVYELAREALIEVRSGKGPYLVHAKTIRFREHAEGSYYWNLRESGYRNVDQLHDDELRQCPITNYVKELIKRNVLGDNEYEDLLSTAKEEVNKALEYALNSPDPNIKSAFKNVYKEEIS